MKSVKSPYSTLIILFLQIDFQRPSALNISCKFNVDYEMMEMR